MKDFINKLRTKSDATKQKIAIGAAFGITFIIVGAWFLGMKSSRTEEVVKEKSASEDLKPLFLIFKNAKEGIKNVKASVQEYKANTKSSQEASAEIPVEEGPEDFTIIE